MVGDWSNIILFGGPSVEDGAIKGSELSKLLHFPERLLTIPVSFSFGGRRSLPTVDGRPSLPLLSGLKVILVRMDKLNSAFGALGPQRLRTNR